MQDECPECSARVGRQRLCAEQTGLTGASDAALAQLGLAEVLNERGDIRQASYHLERGLALLDGKPIPRPVAEIRERLQDDLTTHDEVWALALRLQSKESPGEITGDALEQLWRLCENSPRAWVAIPVEARQCIGEALIDGGHVELAARFIEHALSGSASATTAESLRNKLDRACDQQCKRLVEQARVSLDDSQPERASQLATRVLDVHREHTEARLLRGRAEVRLGHYLRALDDLRAVMNSGDEALAAVARLEAAHALELHGEWEGALSFLEGAQSAEASSIRARLDRRRTGTPVVISVAADGVVTHDTLQRVPTSSAVHAMFAVSLRMVGHLSASASAGRYDQLLNANFEFFRRWAACATCPATPSSRHGCSASRIRTFRNRVA